MESEVTPNDGRMASAPSFFTAIVQHYIIPWQTILISLAIIALVFTVAILLLRPPEQKAAEQFMNTWQQMMQSAGIGSGHGSSSLLDLERRTRLANALTALEFIVIAALLAGTATRVKPLPSPEAAKAVALHPVLTLGALCGLTISLGVGIGGLIAGALKHDPLGALLNFVSIVWLFWGYAALCLVVFWAAPIAIRAATSSAAPSVKHAEPVAKGTTSEANASKDDP